MQGEPGFALLLGSSEGPGIHTQVLQKALVPVARVLPGWSGIAISGPSHFVSQMFRHAIRHVELRQVQCVVGGAGRCLTRSAPRSMVIDN